MRPTSRRSGTSRTRACWGRGRGPCPPCPSRRRSGRCGSPPPSPRASPPPAGASGSPSPPPSRPHLPPSWPPPRSPAPPPVWAWWAPPWPWPVPRSGGLGGADDEEEIARVTNPRCKSDQLTNAGVDAELLEADGSGLGLGPRAVRHGALAREFEKQSRKVTNPNSK